jgi:protein CWC15
MLPAHTKLKLRQKGQRADGNSETKAQLKRILFEREEEHLRKIGKYEAKEASPRLTTTSEREKILAETRDIDASDSDTSQDESASDSGSDSESEDETELLKQELAKIKAERDAARRKEEEELARAEQEKREREIAYGNPLLNAGTGFEVKRSWMEDTVFKNQAKADTKESSGFVNDMIRSEFHRKFMDKYVK